MNTQIFTPYTLYVVAGVLAATLFNSWTSRINQFFFFSRTVQPGFDQTPEARVITLTYRTRIWLALAPALMVYLAMVGLAHLPVIASLFITLIVLSLLNCATFALAHRDAGKLLLQHPQELSAAQPEQGGGVSLPLLEPSQFTPKTTALLLSAPIVVALAWGGSMFASHMGFDQFTDAQEAAKASFLSGLGMGLIAGSLLLFVLIRYYSRHRTPMGRFTVSGAIQLAWIGALALIACSLAVPLHFVFTVGVRQAIMGVLLGFVALRLLYVWTRSRLFTPPQVERNGDQNWRLGMFYFNPADPTLFIQHRSSPGYTVNFANFLSWPLTLLLAADLVFLAVLSSRH